MNPLRRMNTASSPVHLVAIARRRVVGDALPGAPCTVKAWKTMQSPGSNDHRSSLYCSRFASISGMVSPSLLGCSS